MKEPERLLGRNGLPDSLRDALRALERQTPPADTVARVQRSLSALPSAGATSPLTLSAGWGAATYSAAAIAVGVVALAMLVRGATSAEREAPTEHAREQRTAPPSAAEVESSTAASPAREAPTAPAAVSGAEPRTPPAASRSRRVEPLRAAREAAVTSQEKGSPRAPALEPRTSRGQAHLEATPAPVSGAAPSDDSAARTAAARQPSAPAPEDEAGLLYRAKRAARGDRNAAWGMVQLHEQHFPQGALVEEREVLAIQLLRRMGRVAEAEERAASFVSHFPRSSYRSSVQR